jgi:hypothetical protein
MRHAPYSTGATPPSGRYGGPVSRGSRSVFHASGTSSWRRGGRSAGPLLSACLCDIRPTQAAETYIAPDSFVWFVIQHLVDSRRRRSHEPVHMKGPRAARRSVESSAIRPRWQVRRRGPPRQMSAFATPRSVPADPVGVGEALFGGRQPISQYPSCPGRVRKSTLRVRHPRLR